MYDELLKRLRERGVFLFPHHGESRSYDADLLHEAADAIEELIDKLNHADDQIERLVEAAEERRWIPVTDWLPEEWKPVLCYYEYFRYGEYNCMFRTIDRGYYGDGVWGGEAGQGHRNKVLAWMPLPQPPKEGEI